MIKKVLLLLLCFLMGCLSQTAALRKFEIQKDSIEIDVLKYLKYADSLGKKLCEYTKPEIEYQNGSDTCIVTIIRQDCHDCLQQKNNGVTYGIRAGLIIRIDLRKKRIVDISKNPL